jgi:general secretion pathway protein D
MNPLSNARPSRRALPFGARRLAWLVALACAGCAAPGSAPVDGTQLIAEGRVDEGLAQLEQAAKALPPRAEAHNLYVTQRNAIVGALIRDADSLRLSGDPDAAEARYRSALRYDPNAVSARAGIDAVGRDRRWDQIAEQARQAWQRGDLAAADRLSREVLAQNSSHRGARSVLRAVQDQRSRASVQEPRLNATMARKISLELKDVPLRTAIDIIAKTGGVNFVLDRDVKGDQKVTVYVRDTSLEDMIKVLLATNQLDRKVLSDNSVIVYPNTPAKQREYQDLVMRSFYLANADVKQTAAMIRALVKTRDLFIDEKLNLLIMKDTPDAVRLAEQLVMTQDLGEPEVMLELEVLEVASSVISEIGIRYPQQVSVGIGTAGSDGALPDIARIGSGGLKAFVANPVFLLNLRRQDGLSNLLANPSIRVKNREKAKIHIGERVPVITTTSTANVGVSSSVNYLETGLKLDVEPNIYLEDEVAIKVQLEVSNILEQLNIQGTVSYRLGTRSAATTLRLKDGETQVLAGLINNEDRRTIQKVPGASNFPVLGRLFQNNDGTLTKTEIVLLITPRVVRNLSRPDTVTAQFASGTDGTPGGMPLRLSARGDSMSMRFADTGTMVVPATGALGGTAPAGSGGALSVMLSAPDAAMVGQEFNVALSLPAGNDAANAAVTLSFDPAVLQVVGNQPAAQGTEPAPAEPGKATVNLSSAGVAGLAPPSASIRMRVVARGATSTQIAFDVTSSDRPVSAPATHGIGITMAGGG